MIRPNRLPLLALFFLSLIWGYNWVVMKVALASCPPLLFASMRVMGGAVVLLLILKAMGRPIPLPPLGYILPLGLFQSTGFVGLTLWALEFGGAGKTAVLVYMMPIWLLLLAWPFLGQKIRGLEWISLLLSFCGLLLILEPWHVQQSVEGTLLAILSGISWAASAIWQKRKAPGDLDLLNATVWQMILGGAVLTLLAFAVDPVSIHPTPGFFMALSYNAILGNALAWLLWSYALHHLPPGVAGMGTLLAPLIGVLASWGQLGERPGLLEGAGMGLILLAMMLVSVLHLRPQERLPPLPAQE